MKNCQICNAMSAAIKAATGKDLIVERDCKHSMPSLISNKLKKDLSGLEWLSVASQSERETEHREVFGNNLRLLKEE